MDAIGSPTSVALAAFLAGCILLAAVKLVWGMALWAKSSDHRVGERWGAEHADVVEWAGSEGYVRAGGELWRARSADHLQPGDAVVVIRTEGLTLEVRKN